MENEMDLASRMGGDNNRQASFTTRNKKFSKTL